jgi:hypothetical protein
LQSILQDRAHLAGFGRADEVERHPERLRPGHLALQLLDMLRLARDLQGAALGEPERLAGLVLEVLQLLDRAPGKPGQRVRRADLTGQPGRPRRGLGARLEPIQQHDVAHPELCQVVGGAGAE